MIKRQLYSAPFSLREAASFIFQHYVALTSLYFVHSCTKHRPCLLPSRSEATPHENHVHVYVCFYTNSLLTIGDKHWQKLAATFEKPNQQFTSVCVVMSGFLSSWVLAYFVRVPIISILRYLNIATLCGGSVSTTYN